jgi:hypothetical protein
MKKYNLNHIEKITVIDNKIDIEYEDGTKFTINNPTNISFEKNLKNNNNAPIIDHCI